jgi:AcrR family transcriptional regulator
MAETRNPLTRGRITQTALELVAADGLEALSMRRLAQELDVWPMSVYRHFRDKEDLLDAVASASAADMTLPAGGGSWRETLGALAVEARGALTRQPRELRQRTLLSPGLLRLSDAALMALREAGFSPDGAAGAWGTLLAYVIGSIELDSATDVERHPEVAAAAPELVRALSGGDTAFRQGLERLLDGIAAGA